MHCDRETDSLQHPREPMQRGASSTKPPLVKETAPILQSSYNCQRRLRWLFKSSAPAKTLQYTAEHRRWLRFQWKPQGWSDYLFIYCFSCSGMNFWCPDVKTPASMQASLRTRALWTRHWRASWPGRAPPVSQTRLVDSGLDSTLGELFSFADLKVDSGSLPSPSCSPSCSALSSFSPTVSDSNGHGSFADAFPPPSFTSRIQTRSGRATVTRAVTSWDLWKRPLDNEDEDEDDDDRC